MWQIAQAGHFRWTVNDELCGVIPGEGSFDATSSPFETEFVHGDSAAFVVGGTVQVEVTDFRGDSSCNIYALDTANGEEVAHQEATREKPIVTLDPGRARTAYISDPSCAIRVTP